MVRQKPRRSALLAVLTAVATAALCFPGSPATTSEAAAADKICSSTPFKSTSKARYRLPAAVRTDSGKLFVFAERRNNNFDNNDDGDFDIVMRVSTDNGCSWGKQKTVANHGTKRVSNPVPIYDRARNRVLLFSTVKLEKNYLYLQRINADGSSWTSLGSGRVDVAGWRPGLTGPGHGLVLTKGEHAGRIIFAMGYTRKEEKDKRTTRGIYSDDGGNTWRVGYDRVSPGKLQLIEGTMAELPDGRLLVSYRDNGKGQTKPGTNRVSAISTDGGATVGGYSSMPGVKTVPVQGSLLQTTGGRNLLLFSGPSNTSGKITSRRGMRIFVSTDSGKNWRSGLAVGAKDDPACYSQLVQLNSTTVGLFYENGYTAKKAYWHRIVFKQIRISTIENALLPKFSKTKSPSISGTYKVGKTLKAARGAWSPAPAEVRYQWLRNGAAIAKATGSKYVLKKSDKGKKISVRVTLSKSGYAKASATSAARKVK